MSYFIRVLGTSDPNIHIDELIEGLENDGLSAEFKMNQAESPDNWTMLAVFNEDGEELMQIERCPVRDGEIGEEELNEFRESIRSFQPASSAEWLFAYFDKVKVIYAFELLSASMEGDNFSITASLRNTLWTKTGGILQSDEEGFSNEEGYHILWQFEDDASGEWHMALMNDNKEWIKFVMDLEDPAQRREFKAGMIPQSARRV